MPRSARLASLLPASAGRAKLELKRGLRNKVGPWRIVNMSSYTRDVGECHPRNRSQPLEGSHSSLSLPANLNRRAASNVLTYRWGESIPRTPARAIERRVIAASSSIIRPRRHSANRRRDYEDTDVDLGGRGARARRDGIGGERPTAWRRPCPAPERHADRETGGVSRIRAPLRAGIRLDMRPLWPLLVPALRLGGLLSQHRSDARPPLRGLVVYGRAPEPDSPAGR